MAPETTNLSRGTNQDRAYTVATIGVIAASGFVVVLAITQGRGLYMTSGAWAALAADLAEGTFYRPVHDQNGFGGTRYMPLQFILHAAFWSMLKQPAAAAHASVLVAGAALLGGVFRLLREFDLPPRRAFACSVIAMGALTVQYGLISTRGDTLAAALNVWGLAFCARSVAKKPAIPLAAASVFFALAFMAKFTTVFGFVAAIAYFVANGRRKYAASLVALTVTLIAAMLSAVHVASDGRALDSFLACATGGTSISDLLLSPFKFIYSARLDIPFIMFLALGCVALYARRNRFKDLPSLWFVCTALVTIAIMASPGTDLSHLIDLQVASVAIAAVQIAQAAQPRFLVRGLPAAAIIGAVVLAAGGIVVNLQQDGTRWKQQDQIMAIVGEGTAPMLADDPWVPILANERPFIIDTFAIRTISEQRPEVAEDLFAKLNARFFRAVVLNVPEHIRDHTEATNGDWRGKRWYGELFYPPGFEQQLLNAYEPKAFIGSYIVLLPK